MFDLGRDKVVFMSCVVVVDVIKGGERYGFLKYGVNVT